MPPPFVIDIDPVAFMIGTREIRWYGIIVAIAIVVVILWGYSQIEPLRKQGKLPARPDFNVIPAAIIGGMAGAKLLHIWERLDFYLQYPAEAFSGGGLAIFGGVLGSVLGVWIYIKFSRRGEGNQHFGFFTDLVTPGILLGQAVGRVGCFVNGCCGGKAAPEWLPWSVVYTHPSNEGFEACTLLPPGIGLHPTQVYEIRFALSAFGILLRIRKRLQPMEGALFFVYMIMYSAWRFGIAYFRVDKLFFGLSQAQIVSLVILAISIFLLLRLTRRFQAGEPDQNPPTQPPAENTS